MYGGSQAPTSDSDEEESDEPEEEDYQSRGMLFREKRQDLEKKMDRAAKEREGSSEDSDTSDCDSDEDWEDRDEEEEEEKGEQINRGVGQEQCSPFPVPSYLSLHGFAVVLLI